MCTVIGYEKRKARKRHICSLCGAPITAGETYARWLNIDGCVLETKLHHDCEIAIGDYCAEYQEQEWHPDYVQEFMVSTLKDDGVVIDEKTVSYNDIVQIYTEVYHKKEA